MARMIPQMNTYSEFKTATEKDVYESLQRKLSDEYTVFYSFEWRPKTTENTSNANPNLKYESDFVILHKEYGLLILEVKGGNAEYESATDKWWYLNNDGTHKGNMKNPFKQAEDALYAYFIPKLNEILSDKRHCSAATAVWFPSLNENGVEGSLSDANKNRVLYKNALKDPKKYIDPLFMRTEPNNQISLTDEEYRAIVSELAPNFRAMLSLNDQNEEFVRVTEEQYRVLDYLKNFREVKVQGSAGTGKTWVALEKARRLAKTLQRNEKVLLICYNTLLRDFLNAQKNNNSSFDQKIDIKNIDNLRNQIIEKNPNNWHKKYKHFIIDEAQDQNIEDFEKIRSAAQKNKGAFYVFYDKNQFIQGDRAKYPEWLRTDENSVELTINCRNTKRIAETAGKLLHLSPESRADEGEKPTLWICVNKEQAHAKLTALLDKYTGEPYNCSCDDICVLTMSSEFKSLYKTKSLGNGKYTLYDPQTRGSGKGYVRFTTVRKFKGLEAKIVIIVDLASDTFAANPSDDYFGDPQTQREMFYTGASRAKLRLELIFTGNDQDIGKFANTLIEQEMCESDYIRAIQEELGVICVRSPENTANCGA